MIALLDERFYNQGIPQTLSRGMGGVRYAAMKILAMCWRTSGEKKVIGIKKELPREQFLGIPLWMRKPEDLIDRCNELTLRQFFFGA